MVFSLFFWPVLFAPARDILENVPVCVMGVVSVDLILYYAPIESRFLFALGAFALDSIGLHLWGYLSLYSILKNSPKYNLIGFSSFQQLDNITQAYSLHFETDNNTHNVFHHKKSHCRMIRANYTTVDVQRTRPGAPIAWNR
jgi:hypothetical protein